MLADYKIETPPVTDDTADAKARDLLDGARAKLGFVPNMYRGMAINPGLLGTYLHGYDLFRSSGNFTPPEQEVVFLVVSAANGCDYCVAAHSMLAVNVSKLGEEHTNALREGRPLENPKLQALAQFTRHMWESRGLPTKSEVAAFKSAGYGDVHILEIILGMAVKTISNYSNHVNHSELDEVFAGHSVDKVPA